MREVHSHSSAEQLAQSRLRRATCAEQLAQSNCTKHLRRATCADQLAQSTCAKRLHGATGAEPLRRATCAEHMRKALARSNWRRATCTDQLAQSTCAKRLRGATGAEHLRRATCSERLRRATCTEHLRAAACRGPGTMQLAQTTFVRNRGAVREESRMMRWISHVTTHTEHRRAQTRSPQRCKKVSPRLDEHLWKMLSGQSSSSCWARAGPGFFALLNSAVSLVNTSDHAKSRAFP